jgi:hypothetical protein
MSESVWDASPFLRKKRRVRVCALCGSALQTPHLNPLPSCKGRGDRSESIVHIKLYMSRYSRLMKSENDRFTFWNIPRASSCALLKPCLIDRFALLKTPRPSASS